MSCEITAIGLASRWSSLGLVASRYRQAPLSRLPKHEHAELSICFVLGGDYRESCGGIARDFRAGDVIVKGAAAIHEDCFGSAGAECLLLELSPQKIRSVGASSLESSTGAYRRLSLNKLGMRICRELRLSDNVTPLAVEALTLEIVVELLRAVPTVRLSPPAWLRRVRGLLEESRPGEVTLGMIASEAGVHPAHISRMFRRHYGQSIGEYLRHKQVEAAAIRLTESDESLVSIANSLGFTDQSHFTRVFAEMKGTTPARYRRSQK